MAVMVKTTLKFNKHKEKRLREALTSEAWKLAKDIQTDYEKTTKTWKTRVNFRRRVEVQPTKGIIKIIVATGSKIYNYVDYGTRPHVIRPKKPGGVLAWNSKFRPKTRARTIASYAGMSAPPTAFAKEVMHPGTKAREFTKTLEKRWRSKINTRLRAAANSAGFKFK